MLHTFREASCRRPMTSYEVLGIDGRVPIIFSLDLIFAGNTCLCTDSTLSPTLIWPGQTYLSMKCTPFAHFGRAGDSHLRSHYGVASCFHIMGYWIRLSSFTPLCITVAPIVARSTHVAPISIIFYDCYADLRNLFISFGWRGQSRSRQHQSTQPACNIRLLPIRRSWYTVACRI